MNHILLEKLVNMGTPDRVIRLALGATLVYFGLITQSLSDSPLINIVSGLFGLLNIVSAIFRICPGYLLGGFSTCKSIIKQSDTCVDTVPQVPSLSKHIRNSQSSTVWAFKRNLLLSITLPVALVLAIFTYLTFEQNRSHKLHIENGAARAVANMALDIESDGSLSSTDSVSQGVVAIVFHDPRGNPVPSIVEKLPTDKAESSDILNHIAKSPTNDAAALLVGDKEMLKVTSSLAENDLRVSVFYDGAMNKIQNSESLVTSLVFTAFLAIWLSGWAAYFIVKRYTNYVSKTTESIKYRNTHDLLTGLINRSGFAEIVTERFEAAQTDNNEEPTQPFAVLIIDIVNFHYFNDALGHKLGDELLKNVALKLQQYANTDESLIRLNGDVFCIVTAIGCDVENANLRAKQIHDSLCQSMFFQEIQIDLQCRIGVVSYPEHTVLGADLLRLGVIALENAKSLKIPVSIYDASKNTHSVKKLTILTGLVSAIENDQFYLVYQPKVDVLTGDLRGVEALIRWEHPVYKNVPPIEFIGWAEKSGLINPLTQWVLNEAELQSQRWREQGYQIPIAINLSPVNLQDDEIIDAIKSSVTEGFLRGGLLELEITENAVVQETANALCQMKEMHSLGVPISIDDFGTGLASFSYLRDFPVSNLKIDRTFVNINDPDYHDQMLLRSMIELGHNLNCVVTAEGVENEETMELLRSLGCDYAQGYHLCRPTSASGVVDWMNDNGLSLYGKENRGYLRNVA